MNPRVPRSQHDMQNLCITKKHHAYFFHDLLVSYFLVLDLFLPHRTPKRPKTYLELSKAYVLNEHFNNCEGIRLTENIMF